MYTVGNSSLNTTVSLSLTDLQVFIYLLTRQQDYEQDLYILSCLNDLMFGCKMVIEINNKLYRSIEKKGNIPR